MMVVAQLTLHTGFNTISTNSTAIPRNLLVCQQRILSMRGFPFVSRFANRFYI
jgi:hypothetical protein